MDKAEKQKQLRAIESEIEEDLDFLSCSVAELKETKPKGWEEAIQQVEESKKELEQNLRKIQSELDPVMQDSDEDSFLLLTDRMIYETIGEYFRYHIWTHPDMEDALRDFKNNGPEALDSYSEGVRKWMVIFGAKKYRENRDNIEKDWMVHKLWVCGDDPGNPFSFKNCVEFRGVMEVEKLRNYLDELAEWDLETLIARYDIFHTTTQRKEKETIMAQRGDDDLQVTGE